MTKGKRWPPEKEKQLQMLVESKTDIAVIAKTLGKSVDAVQKKCARLGLEVVGAKKKITATTTSKLKLPAELPSIEETLKTLVAALKALDVPSLEKAEVLRLRGIIMGCKLYQGLVAEYIHYRELEAELLDLREKYAALTKKSKGTASK